MDVRVSDRGQSGYSHVLKYKMKCIKVKGNIQWITANIKIGKHEIKHKHVTKTNKKQHIKNLYHFATFISWQLDKE